MTLRAMTAAMRAHLQSRCTTVTSVVKIMLADGGPIFGITELNRNVSYDDQSGDGEIEYLSPYGYTPSAIAMTASLGVDNAEVDFLFAPLQIDGITVEMVNSGAMDNATYIQYLVNYEDLSPTMGHVVLSSGPLGEIRDKDEQLGILEFRSWSQLLKQNSVCELGSKSCRATFGDATTGCYYNLNYEWIPFTVTSVGAETDRVFSAASLGQPDNYFVPGLVIFNTGDNAGKSLEVESNQSTSADTTVTMAHPFYHPIQVGDQGEIRRDCDKSKAACIGFGQILNFRGEPDRPESIGNALQTPNARGGSGAGGTSGTPEQ